jgi:conjugative transfer pilus assembly protein TraH
LLISILGFEIAATSCKTRNDAGTADSGTDRIACIGPATITLNDLIMGGGTGSINENVPLQLYLCMNPDGTTLANGGFDVQKCTDMKKENFNYQGIQGWVNTMLYGGPTSGNITADSILGKINQGGSFQFTDAQKAFIRQSGLPLANLLTKTSNASARITMSEKLSAYLANCVGARFGEALYKSARSVAWGHNIGLSNDVKSNVAQLGIDFEYRAQDCVKSNTTLEIANTLIAAASLNANSK